MSGWPVWLGDIPTWITTFAIVLAALQFLADRKRRAAEEDREAKAQASGLSTWTVTGREEPRRYGVMILNASNSTFHDVVIHVVMHRSPVARPIELKILPPGRYFVELNRPKSQYTWAFPTEITNEDLALQPYMNSDEYRITALSFADNLNQKWRSNDHAVLTSV